MRIVITIEIPDDGEKNHSPVVRISPANAGSKAGDAVNGSSDPAPGQPSSSSQPFQARQAARAALEAIGERDPESLLRMYAPERILEVCQAAARQKGRISNLAGWVATALRKGWHV